MGEGGNFKLMVVVDKGIEISSRRRKKKLKITGMKNFEYIESNKLKNLEKNALSRNIIPMGQLNKKTKP